MWWLTGLGSSGGIAEERVDQERPDRQERETDQTGALVRALRGGDVTAAAELLDAAYRESLLRFCWGYLGSMEEAEDAIQDIWYKVLTAGRAPERFRPWLYKIARNQCLNIIRTKGRRKDRQELPAASQVEATMTGNLTRLVRSEMRCRITELVGRLPDTQREVLRLRYVEALSRAEIAEILELSESVVKSRLFEAIKALREHDSLLGG